MMSEHQNPTKEEIEDWLDQKLHELLIQENKTPQISKKSWLDHYIYTEIHEIFFTTFSSELYDWIVRLADIQGRCKLDQPIVWTLESVRKVEASEYKIVQAVNHWLDQIIGVFITEFTIDMTVSYSEAERCFLKGPRGKYIKYLNTQIKMLLCEKTGDANTLMSGTTWSGKVYKGIEGLGNSPLISPPQASKEEHTWVSVRSAVSLIRQCIPQLSSPLMPPLMSPPSPPSSPTPPPPNHKFSMVSAIKLRVFRGVGNEDPYQFWFVVRTMWEVHGVTNENIKKATLVSVLQDRTLTWYIKHSNDHPNAGIAEIQIVLNIEFS